MRRLGFNLLSAIDEYTAGWNFLVREVMLAERYSLKCHIMFLMMPFKESWIEFAARHLVAVDYLLNLDGSFLKHVANGDNYRCNCKNIEPSLLCLKRLGGLLKYDA